MSKHVCVLAAWEVEELLERSQTPHCAHHKHIKVAEAEELTGEVPGELFRPAAQWIGKDRRRIKMLTERIWITRKTASGHQVRNLVETRDLPSGRGTKQWNAL